MIISKSVRLSAGAAGIVALLAATNVFAQSQCSSRTATEAAGNFVVTVAQTTQSGFRTYSYSLQSPSGKNPNKFFMWLKRNLNLPEEGLTFQCVGVGCGAGVYVTPHQTSGGFPPKEAWRVAHHEDGVVFTSIAIGHVFKFKVKERFKPEESVTTILLGRAGGDDDGTIVEHCGPIFGPMTPLRPEFEGSPLAVTTGQLCFTNGCCYNATVDLTQNIITSMTPDPGTPFETPPGVAACTVASANCAQDLALVSCPEGEIGRPPLKSQEGGTCYYKNIKFTC